MLAHLFPTFWFASFSETGQFQRRSLSPKSFYSAAFRKIRDCGAWYLGVSSPPTEGFWPSPIAALFFESRAGQAERGSFGSSRGSRRLAAAGSSCRGPLCAVSHPPEPQALLRGGLETKCEPRELRAGHPGSVTWVKSGAVSLSLGPS